MGAKKYDQDDANMTFGFTVDYQAAKTTEKVLSIMKEKGQSSQEISAKELGEVGFGVLEAVQRNLTQHGYRTLVTKECKQLVLCVWSQ